MMNGTVRDTMSPATSCVYQHESLLHAAKKLYWAFMSAVPVVDSNGGSAGLITVTDVMKHLAAGEDLSSVIVRDLPTESPVLSPDDSLEDAIKLVGVVVMVPVVAEGKLVGVLSSHDIQGKARLARVLGPRAVNVISEVSPADLMARGKRGQYWTAGASALECVGRALEVAGITTVGSILDFPCGHGRITRVLRAQFPDAVLTACDLDREAVDFCARVFGAVPAYSADEPNDVELGREFDLIWCGSLFTHFDGPRWTGFLGLLAKCLAPEGLLVFTTHGRHPPAALRAMNVVESNIRDMLESYDRSGLGFSRYPGLGEYGLTIASADWVRTRVEQANLRLIDYGERAWEPPSPRQDVYSCVRDGS